MRILKVVFALILFYQVSFAIECGPQKLEKAKPNQVNSIPSEKYQTEYDHAYTEQVKAIEKLKKTLPEGKKAREVFFETPAGKKSLKQLENLRYKFGYDSVAYYMFDDEVMNLSPEHYTKVILHEGKKYYLNKDRVIAYVEKLAETEFRLVRLNATCDPKQSVSFTTLNPEVDSAIRYKIDQDFCSQSAIQWKRAAVHVEEVGQNYIADWEDEGTLPRLRRDCKILKPSGTAANSKTDPSLK